MNKTLIGLTTLFLAACSAKVSTNLMRTFPPLESQAEITVIGISEEAPASATEIGVVKIGDSGFSVNCGWEIVIEKAKAEARKAGGNVLKITEHIPPSMMGSSCDRITARILQVKNPNDILSLKSKHNSVVDSTWKYAKLYVYRPVAAGALIGYDLYLGDSVIWRAKHNSREEILITKKGKYSLWAKTEAKAEVPIEIEYGREYYLKCSMEMGVLVGRPKLQLVDREQGKEGYNATRDK